MHYLDAKYDAGVVAPVVANPCLDRHTPQDIAFFISKASLFICILSFKSLILKDFISPLFSCRTNDKDYGHSGAQWYQQCGPLKAHWGSEDATHLIHTHEMRKSTLLVSLKCIVSE